MSLKVLSPLIKKLVNTNIYLIVIFFAPKQSFSVTEIQVFCLFLCVFRQYIVKTSGTTFSLFFVQLFPLFTVVPGLICSYLIQQ